MALLERHGDVVLREELRARLWPDDTFVEFDKSLGVALAKVRAALGDDAANPRFVETIPKRGYRFIAPATVVGSEAAGAVDPAHPATSGGPVQFQAERHRVRRALFAAASVVVVLAIAAFFFWRANATPRLTARAGVVVGNFTNTTDQTSTVHWEAGRGPAGSAQAIHPIRQEDTATERGPSPLPSGEPSKTLSLANDANLMGRYDVAENASRRTVALEPNRLFGYTNLTTALVGLKRYDDAKAVCRQALEHFPDGGSAHMVLYALAAFERDPAAMTRELRWSDAHPDRSEILFEQAEWSAFRGRPVEAEEMFDEVARRDRAAGTPETSADALVNGAEFEAFMGRADAAMKTAAAALKIADNEVVLGLGALVYALGGRDNVAQKLLQEAAEHHPLSTMTMGVYGPTARGVLAGNASDATGDAVAGALAPGVPYEWGQEAGLAPSYVRGVELLRLHAWTEAARAFQEVIDHAGVDPVSPIGSLSYLGLARANAALGRRDESRQAYVTVLRFWQDAEPDFALLAAARKEYAALR